MIKKSKAIALILVLSALTFLFCGCGADKPEIEDCEWTMRYAMHTEDGTVVMDATENEVPPDAYPNAKTVKLTLVAKDGIITVTDMTNNKIYTGSYTVDGKNPEGTDYKVIIDGTEGNATVAMTTFADGTKEPTLPINLGIYSLYFYGK